MPNGVAQRIHQLAKSSNPGIMFTDQHNREYGDDDYEPDEEEDDDVTLGNSIAGVDESEIADLNHENDNTSTAPDPPPTNGAQDGEPEVFDLAGEQEQDDMEESSDKEMPPPSEDDADDDGSQQPDGSDDALDDASEQEANDEQEINKNNDNTHEDAEYENGPDEQLEPQVDNEEGARECDSSESNDEKDEPQPTAASVRELKKLEVDGKMPMVLPHRTRQQARAHANNLCTAGVPELGTPDL